MSPGKVQCLRLLTLPDLLILCGQFFLFHVMLSASENGNVMTTATKRLRNPDIDSNVITIKCCYDR